VQECLFVAQNGPVDPLAENILLIVDGHFVRSAGIHQIKQE
jgi:hypothetical protein